MNHWMWVLSLVGILGTAVVLGTDMFFFDDRPFRSSLGFPGCRNRSHGFLPHVRRRADADLGRLGDPGQLAAGRLQQEWAALVLLRIPLDADSVRHSLQSLVKTN